MRFELCRDDNVLFSGEIANGCVQMWGPNEFTVSGTVKANGRLELKSGGTLFATGHLGDRGRIELTDHTGAGYSGTTRD